jgi:ABC-type Na+ efflux pump permease subunit
MYRTYVIVRHTLIESLMQPIYALMLAVGTVVIMVFAALPFFTLGEDTKMFKAVGLDVMLLLVLVATLFATSKSIFDEIEDRTMLTLMSKPIYKWEVLVGKFLGIIASAAIAIAILGAVMALCLYWRIPGDNMLRVNSLDEIERNRIHDIRVMHVAGLIPSLVLMWLQISTLAAVGVALSTRFSLVVNLPAVLILYIAGNLTRFMFPMYLTGTHKPGTGGALADQPFLIKIVGYLVSLVLPYLEPFDLRPLTIYLPIHITPSFITDPQGTDLSTIWKCVALAGLFAATYCTFALSAGMWMFQTRELGGAEG